jgi:bacteriocin biosynthesis cyclodehydratase domain-containing protein
MGRPALKAGLMPLWRDRETVQIGMDPRRAVALSGLGKAAAILSLLDGARDTDEILATAQSYGISRAAAADVLELLSDAGVLQDYPARLHRALPDYLRARLAPEMACAALAYGDGDGGARVMERRRSAYVRVRGGGRVGACVATLLAASGLGRVSCADDRMAMPGDVAPAGLGEADLGAPRAAGVTAAIGRVASEVRTTDDDTIPDLVVFAGADAHDEAIARALMLDRIPHLAVRAAEAIGVVGPLVVPGKSACLRCIHLMKAAADPAWPRILAQSGPASPEACDTVLAAATAALASAQALAFIDGAGPEPAATNGTLELVLPDWQWRRRTWPAQPACSCGAASIRQ